MVYQPIDSVARMRDQPPLAPLLHGTRADPPAENLTLITVLDNLFAIKPGFSSPYAPSCMKNGEKNEPNAYRRKYAGPDLAYRLFWGRDCCPPPDAPLHLLPGRDHADRCTHQLDPHDRTHAADGKPAGIGQHRALTGRCAGAPLFAGLLALVRMVVLIPLADRDARRPGPALAVALQAQLARLAVRVQGAAAFLRRTLFCRLLGRCFLLAAGLPGHFFPFPGFFVQPAGFFFFCGGDDCDAAFTGRGPYITSSRLAASWRGDGATPGAEP